MLEVKNLSKQFGRFEAVKNANFAVDRGEIVGFVGPNGAGKSTTIDMILGLTKPEVGEILINSEILTQKSAAKLHQKMGFLSTDMNLDRNLTGYEALAFFAHLRGDWTPAVKNNIKKLAVEINANLNKKIKKLSRGNRQKIGLIASIMNAPELLVMDEPTSGFDPIVQSEFIRLLKAHKAQGGSALISSHNLSEIAEICDRVVFIVGGRIVDNQSMNGLREKAPKREIIDLDAVLEKLVDKNPDQRLEEDE